uniref:TGF-beta family profile domain-containing protein n=1 Tax=Romanomermis culicivorax TaxID=13658 RepID=A0A915IFF9_ROMCU
MQKSTTTKFKMFFSGIICILLSISPYSKSFEQFLKNENSNPTKKSPITSSSALNFYMKGLFSKYGNKNSDDWPSGADTVRSIEPIYGYSHRYSILYDLDVVDYKEKILEAEIHVNLGRRFWHKNYYGQASRTRPPLRCWATLSVNESKKLFDLPLKCLTSLKAAEWWTFDAREIVEGWTRLASGPNRDKFTSKIQLSIAFEQLSPKKLSKNEEKFVPVQKILRHHQTFLLIFTKVVPKLPVNNNRLLMENILATKLANQTHEKSFKSQSSILNRAKRYVKPTVTQKPLFNSVNKISYGRRDYHNYYAYSTTDQRQQLAHQPTVYDKKSFDHVIKAVEKYSAHGPTVLEDAKKIRQKAAKDTVDRALRQGIDDFGDNGKKVNKQRQKTTGKTSTKEQKKRRQKVSSSTIENSKKSSTVSSCKRHDLIVEFSDIGWGDFIIAPKSFEAHYCAGSCGFPLSKLFCLPLSDEKFFSLIRNTNPSNHAIIQSIIHAVGLHPNVPRISCAPDKMDSLSLLYQDPHRNALVLKNYPKMTVKSCSCL